MAGKVKRGTIKLQRWVRANERLLIVAASSCIMSVSHTALRPVLPVFAKARYSEATCLSDVTPVMGTQPRNNVGYVMCHFRE